jgi:hypothetical protein
VKSSLPGWGLRCVRAMPLKVAGARADKDAWALFSSVRFACS